MSYDSFGTSSTSSPTFVSMGIQDFRYFNDALSDENILQLYYERGFINGTCGKPKEVTSEELKSKMERIKTTLIMLLEMKEIERR